MEDDISREVTWEILTTLIADIVPTDKGKIMCNNIKRLFTILC